MTINFRQQARDSLSRARIELASTNDARLKYAALELRMAMESLTYDRAQSYQDDIPPGEYHTWQPRKLLQVLLEIDGNADKGSSLSFGREEVLGQEASTMTSLGKEAVLSLRSIKAHYDAIGSYLHVPTLKKQQTTAPPDQRRLREHCMKVSDELEQCLASPIWNINFRRTAQMACIRCNHIMRKRLPNGTDETLARCFECDATYQLESAGDGQVSWCPLVQEVACQAKGCGKTIKMWDEDIKAGSSIECPHCRTINDIKLTIHARN